jgi:hypothetical protein
MTIEDDVVKYFELFSKMEYALKNSGFVLDKGYAEADWNSFINHVSGSMTINMDDNIKYLMEKPPKKQIVIKGIAGYPKEPHEKIKDGDYKEMICACKRIRNNLFHGGKMGNDTDHSDEDPNGDPDRNAKLITAAIKILEAAKNACPIVKEKFDQAKLKP